MKNTQVIKENLSKLATLEKEELVKTIGETVALLDADTKDYDELKSRHDTLIVDYGKLVTMGFTSKADPNNPDDKQGDKTPKSIDEIIEETLNKKEK